MREHKIRFAATMNLVATLLLGLVTAERASAQQVGEWNRCQNGVSPDARISGCTAIIQSGQETQLNLAQAFSLRGNAYFAKGDYDSAWADYNQSISLNPDSGFAYSGRGAVYYMKGYYDEAIADDDQALRLMPNSITFKNRGDAYVYKGNFDQAIEDYNEAIRLNPNLSLAFGGRGTAYYYQGDYDQAIADYNQSLSLDPNNSLTYAGRGNAYSARGNYDQAITDYNRSLSLDPNNSLTYAGRGNAYYGQGNVDQAILEYDQAIRLDARNALPFLWRGNAYKAKGERSIALANYDEAIRLELNPANNFAFPSGFDLPENLRRGVQFAVPPLPNEAQLRQCRSQSPGEDEFFKCVVGQALPREYRIGQTCLNQNTGDGGRALLCTTQRQDILDAYDKFRSVQQCASGNQNNWAVAQCMGRGVLGQDEQYYLGCVTANKGDLKTAAVCAVAKDLTPEQQIALSCAVATGAQPHAFAVCAGGQLLIRELDKCWTGGIHTEGGCFGPNNEYVKFINNIDAEAERIMGSNSAAYRAWKLWKDNVLAPGPNGEVVKFFNNGMKDLREGPGPNNEIVKLGNSAGDAIQSLGNSFGL